MMMNDRPNWVCENIRTAFGRPDSATSSGTVTCFSTSSGARPGYSVMTLTCVSVTSGNASIGSALNAAKPPATNSARPRTMNSGFCSANATIRLIIGLAAVLRRGAAAQLPMKTMQEQVALDDDFLSELHPGGDAGDAIPHGVDFHFLARVAAGLLLDEDEVLPPGEQQRPLGDLQVRG